MLRFSGLPTNPRWQPPAFAPGQPSLLVFAAGFFHVHAFVNCPAPVRPQKQADEAAAQRAAADAQYQDVASQLASERQRITSLEVSAFPTVPPPPLLACPL